MNIVNPPTTRHQLVREEFTEATAMQEESVTITHRRLIHVKRQTRNLRHRLIDGEQSGAVENNHKYEAAGQDLSPTHHDRPCLELSRSWSTRDNSTPLEDDLLTPTRLSIPI